MSSPPTLNFTLSPTTGSGFPVIQNDAFALLLDQAISGGSATSTYLNTMLQFSTFASYLNQTGRSVYSQENAADGTLNARATDGTTTLTINLGLTQGDISNGDPPVFGIATMQMALPDPNNITKIAQFAISLLELPPGFTLSQQVYQSLFSPLVSRLSTWLQTSIENWSGISGEDAAADLGGAVDSAAADAAEAVSADAAEVVVGEEVVAVAAIDLSAAFPPLAALGLLVAIPAIISALSKNFGLHLEINNLTSNDFTWSTPYQSEGAVIAQPTANLVPAMGTATDSWGDQTDVPVVFQADFAAMNSSGFSGIGFLVALSPVGINGEDICLLISIPWLADNVIWMGDPGSSPDWRALYNANCGGTGQVAVDYGTRAFSSTLSIDAVSGNQDVYHCALRIEEL